MDSIHLNDLSSGLNVIYGANEAGKSRARDFIEWLMFSYTDEHESLKPSARKNAFAHLIPGVSGVSHIAIGDSTVRLTQKRDNNETHAFTDSLSLSDLSSVLTDNVSREHYTHVFSLTLDELNATRSNKLMTEEELAEVFLSASQTGSGVSLAHYLSTLRKKRDEMFSESGNARNRAINKVVKQLQDITKEINQLKRDENNAPHLDEEIATHTREVADLVRQIDDINSSLRESRMIAQSYSDYASFQTLSESLRPETNSDLAHRVAEIEVLLAEVKNSLGKEHERDLLLDQLQSLQQVQSEQGALLTQTLDPNELKDYARTPNFLSIVKRHEKVSHDGQRDLLALREKYHEQERELTFIQHEAEKIAERIAKNSEKPPTQETPVAEVPKSRLRTALGIAAMVVGVGFIVASIALSQFVSTIAGVIVTLAGLAALIFGPSRQAPVEPSSTLQLDVETDSEKLGSFQSRIEHFQGILSDLLDQQAAVEKKIESSRQEYEDALVRAGFENNVPMNLIDIYLSEYSHFHERTQKIEQLSQSIEKYEREITSLLDQTENLRSFAIGTASEISMPLATLSAATTWLVSLLNTAREFKDAEDNAHSRDIKLQESEKILTQRFGSIEAARTIFAEQSLQELNEKINVLDEHRKEIEVQRDAINQEIGSLTHQKESASTSTAIADAQRRKQELVDELQYLHHDFSIAARAVKIAEEAFTYCQRENQPAVLRTASSMLRRATMGAWDNVSIVYVEQGKKEPIPQVHVSQSTTGKHLPATQLSRGTQEQLYLCLRFALMSTSIKGQHIPALLDDVAVNFDSSRLRAIAPLLGDIARQRQIFYFTCHEKTRDELATIYGSRVISI
jgi:uncharacterized protein YhaN